jgi:CubicO group peptidase (beta-lactamase class C family)
MVHRICWIVFSLALGMLGACTAPLAPATPSSVNPTSASHPLAPSYQRAAEYSRQHKGLAVIVLRGGQIVFEEYQNGFTAQAVNRLASGTKSFAGILAVAAVQDGLLKLEERAAATLLEWQNDPRKSQITIRQILNQVDGMEDAANILQGQAGITNKYEHALSLKLVADPGIKFIYGPSHFSVFGEIMRRKLKSLNEDPLAYLERRVLYPIGFKYARWTRDQAGNPQFFAGTFTTARDWTNFGLFIKNRGVWNGKPLISADLMAECFKGSTVNPAYGLTFWLNAPTDAANASSANADSETEPLIKNPGGGKTVISQDAPADLVMAAGAGKQRLYIIPSLDMVITRFGDGGPFEDSEFLGLLLGK